MRLEDVVERLDTADREFEGLPGLTHESREPLARQIVDSVHRGLNIGERASTNQDTEAYDLSSSQFDALALIGRYQRAGSDEEALWLTFLVGHFGQHFIDGFSLLKRFYGNFGSDPYWTWERVQNEPLKFEEWWRTRWDDLRNDDHSRSRFGIHRPYETLDPASDRSTLRVLNSYMDMVRESGGQRRFIQTAQVKVGQQPDLVFDYLLRQVVKNVHRFGRLAAFDYVNLLSKIGLAPAVPGHPYIIGSSGPLRGARLLFTGSPHDASLDDQLDGHSARFGSILQIDMQAVEDALCNWQKHPEEYRRYD